jgi:signal transduction histidine kinase
MNKTCILIVEDEGIIAKDIENILQELGYSVPAIASSGEEAISFFEKFKPDLILMDIVLQGKVDGIEAAQIISKCSKVPIIFLTAYSDQDTFDRAKSSAPYGYIRKPFETRDLQMTIELALFKNKMQIESLKETTRLKDEFLSNMTHEIRTPLGIIIGFSDLLHTEKAGPLSVQQKEIVENILLYSHSLLRLLSDILDFTQAQSDKMEFYPTLINLTNLLNEVTKVHEIEMTNRKIQLNLNISQKLSDINIDPEKLKNILDQFLSNAIKFSHDNSTIDISAYPKNEDRFRIEVRDYGIGICEKDINNLFIPFQQLSCGPSKSFQGAGLGLALVRSIVEAQQGKVGVDSTLGKGSVFYAIFRCHN